ncbi:MAG: hypothetical protein LBG99_03765 [Propionibacteriaceae bacterium]|jgi:ribulose-phosphate 3-epimerase|nr:hypothetical protein [Propionibacteriaceae bacterium]
MRVGSSLWNVAGSHAREHARRLVDAGVTVFHWDRSDGIFAHGGGFTSYEAGSIAEEVGVSSEAHLMMSDPYPEIDQWCEFCEMIVVHVEVESHMEAIRRIEQRGRQPAIAICPSTPLDALDHLPNLPILVMAITPGHAGGSWHTKTIDRLSMLSTRGLIGVDGGITLEHIPRIREAGSHWIAVGTALVNHPDPQSWLRLAQMDTNHLD